MRENSIFIITQPDMMLSTTGPSITVISTNKSFIDEIEAIHGNMFKNVPVIIYHPDGHVTEENLPWTISVMRFSDSVFVDLATANDVALVASVLSDKEVIYINTDKQRNDLAGLFNIIPDNYQVFDTLQDYMEYMYIKHALE